MEITLSCRPDIKCPKCKTEPKITTGFWGSILMASFLNRLEHEGGTVTCPKCKNKYIVDKA